VSSSKRSITSHHAARRPHDITSSPAVAVGGIWIEKALARPQNSSSRSQCTLQTLTASGPAWAAWPSRVADAVRTGTVGALRPWNSPIAVETSRTTRTGHPYEPLLGYACMCHQLNRSRTRRGDTSQLALFSPRIHALSCWSARARPRRGELDRVTRSLGGPVRGRGFGCISLVDGWGPFMLTTSNAPIHDCLIRLGG
jgi:hypothetical protein